MQQYTMEVLMQFFIDLGKLEESYSFKKQKNRSSVLREFIRFWELRNFHSYLQFLANQQHIQHIERFKELERRNTELFECFMSYIVNDFATYIDELIELLKEIRIFENSIRERGNFMANKTILENLIVQNLQYEELIYKQKADRVFVLLQVNYIYICEWQHIPTYIVRSKSITNILKYNSKLSVYNKERGIKSQICVLFKLSFKYASNS